MTFLLAHCVWKETQNVLEKAGFPCVTLHQLNESNAPDKKVITIAKSQKAILITRDRDFSNLTIYPLGNHKGIVLLRITPQTIENVHKVLLNTLRIISPENLKGNLLIITSITYRFHRHRDTRVRP